MEKRKVETDFWGFECSLSDVDLQIMYFFEKGSLQSHG